MIVDDGCLIERKIDGRWGVRNPMGFNVEESIGKQEKVMWWSK